MADDRNGLEVQLSFVAIGFGNENLLIVSFVADVDVFGLASKVQFLLQDAGLEPSRRWSMNWRWTRRVCHPF